MLFDTMMDAAAWRGNTLPGTKAYNAWSALQPGETPDYSRMYYKADPYKMGQNVPMINPMTGFEWASAQQEAPSGQTITGWYQRPIAQTQEQQDIQNAFAQTPVQTGMGGLLGQIAPLIQQQVAANPAASAIQPYIENRDPLMQFANPVSPYDYMPMLPSVQANPYLQSDIGGVQVNHNVGLLSYLNPTQAMYDYNTPTAPVTNPYNYNSAGSMFTTGELENLLQKYGVTQQQQQPQTLIQKLRTSWSE